MVFESPHWGYPFRRGHVVEQDSVEHVEAQVARVLCCPMNARVERPEFGVPWPHFRNAPLDLASVKAAVKRWVPAPTLDLSQTLDQINLGEIVVYAGVQSDSESE